MSSGTSCPWRSVQGIRPVCANFAVGWLGPVLSEGGQDAGEPRVGVDDTGPTGIQRQFLTRRDRPPPERVGRVIAHSSSQWQREAARARLVVFNSERWVVSIRIAAGAGVAAEVVGAQTGSWRANSGSAASRAKRRAAYTCRLEYPDDGQSDSAWVNE